MILFGHIVKQTTVGILEIVSLSSYQSQEVLYGKFGYLSYR